MSSKCNAYVLNGNVCDQCGREHKHWLTGKKVVIIIAILVVASAVAYWYLSQRKDADSYDVISADLGHGYWKFRGEGTQYPPLTNPADILAETFVIPPSFKDMRK